MQRPADCRAEFLACPQRRQSTRRRNLLIPSRTFCTWDSLQNPQDSAVLPLDRTPQRTEHRYPAETCTWTLGAALFAVVRFTLAQMPSTGWVDKHGIHMQWSMFNHKKEQSTDLCYNIVKCEHTMASGRSQTKAASFIGRGKSIETESRWVNWGQRGQGKTEDRGNLSFPWSSQWKELDMEFLHRHWIHGCPTPTVYLALLPWGSQTIPYGFLLQASGSPLTNGCSLVTVPPGGAILSGVAP